MKDMITIDGSMGEGGGQVLRTALSLSAITGTVSALPVGIAEAEVGIVGKQLKELELKPEVHTVEAFGPGNYCYAQLNYERCSVVFSSVGTYDKSRKAVGNEVVMAVRDFLKAGKACEKHLADQLLMPLNVLVGGWFDPGEDCYYENWSVDVQKESLHYKTNREVIDAFGLKEDW